MYLITSCFAYIYIHIYPRGAGTNVYFKSKRDPCPIELEFELISRCINGNLLNTYFVVPIFS